MEDSIEENPGVEDLELEDSVVEDSVVKDSTREDPEVKDSVAVGLNTETLIARNPGKGVDLLAVAVEAAAVSSSVRFSKLVSLLDALI